MNWFRNTFTLADNAHLKKNRKVRTEDNIAIFTLWKNLRAYKIRLVQENRTTIKRLVRSLMEPNQADSDPDLQANFVQS